MKKMSLLLSGLCILFGTNLWAQVAVKVRATVPWTDSGIDLSHGEILAINAYGRYMEADRPYDPENWIGPDGYPRPTNNPAYPLPDAAARCLIGKIENNVPFIVASKYMSSAPQSGRLYLGINDINFSNNDGYLIAFITKIIDFAEVVKVDVTKDVTKGEWTESGLDVAAGDSILLISYGVYIEGGTTTDLNDWIGPGGYPYKNTSPGTYPIPDARARGLIGKIGQGNAFVIGDFKRMIAPQSGRLYLGINDIDFTNNNGYCIVFLVRNPITPLVTSIIYNQNTRITGGFHLLDNYPNPFNPETKIRYELPKASHVSLVVFNSLGQKIRTLVNKEQQPGPHTIQWDGKDDSGQKVSTGTYFYTLKAGEFNKTRKALLLR